MLLKDHVAIVTGGGRGIGRAIAEAMAVEAAHVSVWDINEAQARAAAEAIRGRGVRSPIRWWTCLRLAQ